MAVAPVVKVDMVFDRSAEWLSRFRIEASRVVRESAFALEGAIKANIVGVGAVDTGNLLNSVHTEVLDPLSAEVGTGVEYAPYIEFGTYRTRARPYFAPAVQVVGRLFRMRLEGIGI
jgi:phage gpG-like protein